MHTSCTAVKSCNKFPQIFVGAAAPESHSWGSVLNELIVALGSRCKRIILKSGPKCDEIFLWKKKSWKHHKWKFLIVDMSMTWYLSSDIASTILSLKSFATLTEFFEQFWRIDRRNLFFSIKGKVLKFVVPMCGFLKTNCRALLLANIFLNL